VSAPLRFIFDTNIFDKFLTGDTDDAVEDDGLIEQVNDHIDDGKVVVYLMHVQHDEIVNMPEPKTIRRDSLLRVLENLRVATIPTAAAVWDISRWDEAKWGGGAGPIGIGDIYKANPNKSNPNRLRDELIVASASSDADVFVTNENPDDGQKLPKRINAKGTSLQVWSFERFLHYLSTLQLSETKRAMDAP
jgi:hypothetical protein